MITFLSDKLFGLRYVDLIELIARPSVTMALVADEVTMIIKKKS